MSHSTQEIPDLQNSTFDFTLVEPQAPPLTPSPHNQLTINSQVVELVGST